MLHYLLTIIRLQSNSSINSLIDCKVLYITQVDIQQGKLSESHTESDYTLNSSGLAMQNYTTTMCTSSSSLHFGGRVKQDGRG